MQTLLRYPGGKTKAWPQIKELLPLDIKDFREPFFGGGSVSLLIVDDPMYKLDKMIAGDLAPEIWAFWNGVKYYGDDVASLIENILYKVCPYKMSGTALDENDSRLVSEGRVLWRLMQTLDTNNMSLVDRAARTFITNMVSFSAMGDSGCISKNRFYNLNIDSKLDEIRGAKRVLSNIDILNADFRVTMSDVDKDKTFVFLDPPYYQQSKTPMYGRGGDTHTGFPHDEFAEFMKQLPCRWLITYDDSIKVRKMFKGFNMKSYRLKYTMGGGNAMDSLNGEELFISNYDFNNINALGLL